MKEVMRFVKEEDAVSTVEIVLIVIVLVSLVVLFKDQIKDIVNNILSKASDKAENFDA